MNHEVLCIGNAIVDLIADVSDGFIAENGFAKGGMTLVDAEESKRRRAICPSTLVVAGGSAANTAACLASLGTRTAYIGKVGGDDLGALFMADMQRDGVHVVEGHMSRSPTASCLALVTPDGERTMSTFLGACTELSGDDIPEEAVAVAKLVFIEGYLLDSPSAREAVDKTLALAARHGTKVAVTLSDSRCVERHHARFHEISQHPECKLVIANEREIMALCGSDNIYDALSRRTTARTTAVTLGADGCAVVSGFLGGRIHHRPAHPVDRIVDLVGAGDSAAAGFIHSFINGGTERDLSWLAASCASVVIQGRGARPSVRLSTLLDGNLAAA